MSSCRDVLAPLDRLIQGDCLDILKGFPPQSVDLIVTDPPFNIGLDYNGYDDNKSPESFCDMLRQFFAQARRVLKPTGAIFTFMGQAFQADVYRLMKESGFFWRNSIVWHQTFGPCQRRKFTPSWTMIHYFACDPERYTFNLDAIRVPSARQLKYKDRRANSSGKPPDDTWVLLPEEQAPDHFQPDQDAWLISRVCGTFREREGHVTQLPLAIVDRIIKVASNPGELVLDPFAGTGTVLVAARQLGRHFLGIEISPATVAIAEARLARPEAQSGAVGA